MFALLGVLAASVVVAPVLRAQTATAGAPAAEAAPASAQTQAVIQPPEPGVDPAFDERAKRISSRLRCPVCQGESIQDSPATLSVEMRTVVREQLANGRSEAQVLDYFLAKYGQWILLEPRAEGINLLIYWLPVLFIVLGGGGIWLMVRKWTARPASSIE